MNQIKTIDIDNASLFLSGVELFQDLEESIIYDMAGKLQQINFRKGDALIRKGQPGQNMYIIKEGVVTVNLDNKSLNLGKGSVLGEMAILSGGHSTADVISNSDTQTLILSRNAFLKLMSVHKPLAISMTQLMQGRMADSNGIKNVGKYQILQKLGEGGMAIVYNAFDPELEREVAVKMLKYEIATDPEFRDRFRQEAKTIARLKHPNILHVIEVIEAYSTSFIVMEKLEGHDLTYYLKKNGPYSATKTCEILAQVSKALEYAHTQSDGCIIHRDIKLSNIVIEKNGIAKLMDFGIASQPGESPARIEGTANYMAPEIIQGKSINGSVDIYALGITAFIMLTGRAPYAAPSLREILAKHVNEPIPGFRQVEQDVSVNLTEFIKKTMAKKPVDRICDWNEIHRLLKPEGIKCLEQSKLAPGEMGVMIRIHNCQQAQCDEIVTKINQIIAQYGLTYDLYTMTAPIEKKEKKSIEWDDDETYQQTVVLQK